MSDLPTSKVCNECGKPKHLTQYHPATRGPKSATCILCTDFLREQEKEQDRDNYINSQVQLLYS